MHVRQPAGSWTPAAHSIVPQVVAAATLLASLTAPTSIGGASGFWQQQARAAAEIAGIDPDRFERQIGQESGFDPSAVSPAGAVGIAQIMPGTAVDWQVDPTDPFAALLAAAHHMRRYLDTFGGDWSLALAAYNAGEGAVRAHGGVPPYPETRAYIDSILGLSIN